MSKNIAKIIKQSSDKIYIKESTNGSEPSWTSSDEIGYTDEASLQLKSKKATVKEGAGQDIQQNADYDLEINSLQVLDASTLNALKNKNVWIMVKPTGTVSATNVEVKIKNFLLNVETMLDLKTSGKSVLKLSGTKSEYDETAVYAFATSATTVS